MASINWAYLFNGFHGRIGRQTFWIGMIVLTAVELIVHFVAEQIQGERLSAIVDLAFTYPEFAVALKRAHDRDLPVWLLFIFFGAGAVLDLFTVLGLAGTDETPSMLSLAIAVPFAVFGLALFVGLGFRRGRSAPISTGPIRSSRVDGRRSYADTAGVLVRPMLPAAACPHRHHEVDTIFREFRRPDPA